MRELFVPAADLLLGAVCAGCGAAATTLCRPCRAAIRPAPREVWPDPVPDVLRRPDLVTPVAAGPNTAVLREALIAWKERGRWGLTDTLAHLLASAVVHGAEPGRPVVLVPVPTSRRSRRERGADVVDELAGSAARLLRGIGVDVRHRQALVHVRVTADQARLGARERSVNVAGAFAVRSARGLEGRDVVVVDDILTTGATVVESVRALTAAGHRPRGVAVVAATPPPSGARR